MYELFVHFHSFCYCMQPLHFMQSHSIRDDIAGGAHLCVAAFHMSARDELGGGDTANSSACVYISLLNVQFTLVCMIQIKCILTGCIV